MRMLEKGKGPGGGMQSRTAQCDLKELESCVSKEGKDKEHRQVNTFLNVFVDLDITNKITDIQKSTNTSI